MLQGASDRSIEFAHVVSCVCRLRTGKFFLGQKWLFAHHGIAYVRLGVDDQRCADVGV